VRSKVSDHPLTALFSADWWGYHLLFPNAAHKEGTGEDRLQSQLHQLKNRTVNNAYYSEVVQMDLSYLPQRRTWMLDLVFVLCSDTYDVSGCMSCVLMRTRNVDLDWRERKDVDESSEVGHGQA